MPLQTGSHRIQYSGLQSSSLTLLWTLKLRVPHVRTRARITQHRDGKKAQRESGSLTFKCFRTKQKYFSCERGFMVAEWETCLETDSNWSERIFIFNKDIDLYTLYFFKQQKRTGFNS